MPCTRGNLYSHLMKMGWSYGENKTGGEIAAPRIAGRILRRALSIPSVTQFCAVLVRAVRGGGGDDARSCARSLVRSLACAPSRLDALAHDASSRARDATLSRARLDTHRPQLLFAVHEQLNCQFWTPFLKYNSPRRIL